MLAGIPGIDHEVVMEGIRRCVAASLKELKATITLVADELLRRRCLTGSQAENLIRGSMNHSVSLAECLSRLLATT